MKACREVSNCHTLEAVTELVNGHDKRYALIDTNSGFVWWVGDAASPEEACKKADIDTGGEFRGEYRHIGWYSYKSGMDGYVVYEVPACFEVNDGQDQEEIATVESMTSIGLHVIG